ncbi:MAG: response regulator transcription factor [Candidatus Omnitrophica bacterium]|nr:response regulator transcription factor [Candidatus Omnitrophota bacterium]
MSNENILIVEDDKNISKLVKYNLEKAGYSCHAVVTGEEGFTVLDKEEINLIILDVMLPKMDGFEVCRIIRQDDSYSHIPIILLTARGEEIDRIVGLELGADDYIAKPFSPRELVLRVKAILKRSVIKKDGKLKDVLSFDQLKIDIPRHKVSVNSKEVQLTAMEFDLLVMLLNRMGRVQSREQLLSDVWGIEADVTTRTVDTHVKRLRQKLGRYGKYIETVRGYGYRFYEQE